MKFFVLLIWAGSVQHALPEEMTTEMVNMLTPLLLPLRSFLRNGQIIILRVDNPHTSRQVQDLGQMGGQLFVVVQSEDAVHYVSTQEAP